MERPQFANIKSYREFEEYYWYREELVQICKQLGIDDTGNKKELNEHIKEYFSGNIVQKKPKIKYQKVVDELRLDTKLLECGFCFNQRFRDFFIKETGNPNFKFHADMVATAKKVKMYEDYSFTLQDMLDVFYRKKEYAKFDNSSCEWNQFVKDFCADKDNGIFKNKLQVASNIWNDLRKTTKKKIYSKDLVEKYKRDNKI